VLFLRNGRDETVKDFSSSENITDTTPIVPIPNVIQQPVMEQPVVQQQAVIQPPVAEPTVLQQWTDESGFTWRSMSDGTMVWWTGTEWQKR
jgi:hypothetical protein